MDIRRTEGQYVKEGALNISASFKSFRTIIRGRKESAISSKHKLSREPSHLLLRQRLVSAVFEFPSIALSERYGKKPSLTVLEKFLQLFLKLFKSEASQPTDFIRIHAGKFGEFVFSSEIFPGRGSDVFHNSFAKKISEKIQSGGYLYKKIVKGEIDLMQAPQLEEISNLMWFLQAKAEQKSGTFSAGVISIEDPESRLLNYFESYQAGSDIQGFQRKAKSEDHRVINFNYLTCDSSQSLTEHIKGVLPYDKCALLVVPVLGESLMIDENRLLLKMESHGVHNYRSKARDNGSCSGLVGHVWSFIQSIIKKIIGGQSKDGGVCRDERIPSSVTKVYKKLINELKRHKPGEFLAVLQKDNPFGRNSGIHIMARNIENFMLLSSKQAFPDFMVKPLNDFYNTITDYEKYDYYPIRIGNEIIFNTKDLLD